VRGETKKKGGGKISSREKRGTIGSPSNSSEEEAPNGNQVGNNMF